MLLAWGDDVRTLFSLSCPLNVGWLSVYHTHLPIHAYLALWFQGRGKGHPQEIQINIWSRAGDTN